jgi:hypothetical protein
MRTCDYACNACRIKLTNIIVDEADPSKKPDCPKCGHCMGIKNTPPMINMKTSDLPGSNWDTFQPAFNKHTSSKREAMEALAEFNSKERELADEAGRPFNEFQWQPEISSKDKEYQEMAKELGSDTVNDILREKHADALDRDLDKRLDSKWNELADQVGL